MSNDLRATLARLRNSGYLYFVAGLLAGLGVALGLTAVDVSEMDMLARILGQSIILVQIGVLVAAIVYWILLQGFQGSQLEGVRRTVTTAQGSGKRTAAQLSIAEMQNQNAPLVYASWLLPVSGFIGTVLGVSQAIGPLGGMISDGTSAQINPDAIAQVLQGLNVAFDTTLVGLVSVTPVMAMLMVSDLSINRRSARVWSYLE